MLDNQLWTSFFSSTQSGLSNDFSFKSILMHCVRGRQSTLSRDCLLVPEFPHLKGSAVLDDKLWSPLTDFCSLRQSDILMAIMETQNLAASWPGILFFALTGCLPAAAALCLPYLG